MYNNCWSNSTNPLGRWEHKVHVQPSEIIHGFNAIETQILENLEGSYVQMTLLKNKSCKLTLMEDIVTIFTWLGLFTSQE